MSDSLQLDTEQVLKLLELGIESSEKERFKDFQNDDTSSSSSGQSSFLHDVYSTQASQPNLVPGSSVGIAKIISAHLSGKEKCRVPQKENITAIYSNKNEDSYTKQNGDIDTKQNGDSYTKQNGDSYTKQNGDIDTKQNSDFYTKQNKVINSIHNHRLDMSINSGAFPKQDAVKELHETDLLIQQLKEKIQDVNLISDDIKRRLDQQKNIENGSSNRNVYHHKNDSINSNGSINAKGSINKNGSLSTNGSIYTNGSIKTNRISHTDGSSNMIGSINTNQTFQKHGSSNTIGANNTIGASNKNGLIPNDPFENEDEDRLQPDQLKAIMSRLLAEKQRLISQAEEDQKAKPGFVSQTYEERQLLKASESSEEEQLKQSEESNDERRPVVSPKPNDIRRHLASPSFFEDKGLYKISSLTKNSTKPMQRSSSQMTLEESPSEQMSPRPDQLHRKFSIDQSNLSSNQLLKNQPNQLRTRSNSVFATTSGQHDLYETVSSDDDKKKNPAIRKMVYSQYREMLRGYSKSSQKTTST